MMRCSSSSVAALLGAHTRMRGLRARLGKVRLSPLDMLSLQLSLTHINTSHQSRLLQNDQPRDVQVSLTIEWLSQGWC